MIDKAEYNKTLNNLYTLSTRITKVIAAVQSNDLGLGFTFAKTTLIRLHATFLACKSLIIRGYAIESFLLIRFIQEQVSYSYCLYQNDANEEIDKLTVTNCIATYKKRIGHFGKIYGEMSRFVHLDIDRFGYIAHLSPSTRDKSATVSVTIKYNDKNINYDMIWYYCFALFIYLDVVVEMLGLSENSQNKKHFQNAKRIQADIYGLVQYMASKI